MLVFFVLKEITLKKTGEKKNIWKCMNAVDGKEHKCSKYTPATKRMEDYFNGRWVDYSRTALKPLPGPPEEAGMDLN